MPLLDMPLSKLKVYKGINPRPKDFDQYWNKAIREMKSVDPKITLEKADFQASFADCYDMYFTGVGGARIYSKLLRPKHVKKPHPAILMFHGYTCNSGDWMDKLNFVGAGFTVAAMDCRGQGGKSEDVGGVTGNTLHGHIIRGLADSPEKLLFRQIFLDTAQLAGIVMDMEEVDARRVGTFGGSQGGALALACAALEPRIKLTAPLFPFLCDFKRIWEMDLTREAYQDIRDFFYRFDPSHEKEDEIFRKLGYIDIQNLAPRIKAKVLWSVGLMDTVCPPSTQFAAYNKIKSPKSMVIYPDYAHELPPGQLDKIYNFMMKL